MKVHDVIPATPKIDKIKKIKAKILAKGKNPQENDPAVGWNQDMHQGSAHGAFLYR